MRLRERGQREAPAWSTGPDQPSTRRQSTVAVTAAFLTGAPLRVRISDYTRLRADLGEALGRIPGQGWSVDADGWHRQGSYRSGGGFADMLPLVLARRDGPDTLERTTQLLYDRPDDEHAWLSERAPGWTMTPTSARVDLYDLGMAVMNVSFQLDTPSELGLDAVARDLKRLVWLRPEDDGGVASPIASAFKSLAAETTHQYLRAVHRAAGDFVERPWLEPFLDAVPVQQRGSGHDWGRVLWLHPVHVITADRDLDHAAQLIAPTFHQTIDIPNGQFVSGIGWSAIISDPDGVDESVPLRLVELQWAAIALFMEIDRGLLAQLDNLRDGEPHTLAELEAEADSVFADHLRISHALARFESDLAGLGGDEQVIWDTIENVTKFGTIISGVQRKTQTLQQISERRVQLAAATRARRATAILSFLTALTVVTVTTALITIFLGSRSDRLGHLQWRVLIVSAALVASVGLYRAAFRERPLRGR